MENAIKFTNEGNVSLKISRAERFGKYQMIDIEVADTGIGIKDEVAEKVFDPFYQGEYYLNKQYGGVGISLSIVKKLVELLKGTINFTTNEISGTIFLVTWIPHVNFCFF